MWEGLASLALGWACVSMSAAGALLAGRSCERGALGRLPGLRGMRLGLPSARAFLSGLPPSRQAEAAVAAVAVADSVRDGAPSLGSDGVSKTWGLSGACRTALVTPAPGTPAGGSPGPSAAASFFIRYVLCGFSGGPGSGARPPSAVGGDLGCRPLWPTGLPREKGGLAAARWGRWGRTGGPPPPGTVSAAVGSGDLSARGWDATTDRVRMESREAQPSVTWGVGWARVGWGCRFQSGSTRVGQGLREGPGMMEDFGES